MNKNEISELTLEQYLLGELPESKIIQIDELVSKDSVFAERIKNLKVENDRFFATFPDNEFIKRIENQATFEDQKAENQANSLREQNKVIKLREFFNPRNIFSFSAAVAAVVVVIFFSPFNGTNHFPGPGSDIEVTRIKGQSLMVYKKSDSGAEVLGERSYVKEGDLLQVSYLNGTYKYGAILSVDGRGVVSRHLPFDSNFAVNIEENKKVKLPSSYQLDDAPGYERFYFFYSDKPFDLGEIVDQLEQESIDESNDVIKLNSKDVYYTSFVLLKNN